MQSKVWWRARTTRSHSFFFWGSFLLRPFSHHTSLSFTSPLATHLPPFHRLLNEQCCEVACVNYYILSAPIHWAHTPLFAPAARTTVVVVGQPLKSPSSHAWKPTSSNTPNNHNSNYCCVHNSRHPLRGVRCHRRCRDPPLLAGRLAVAARQWQQLPRGQGGASARPPPPWTLACGSRLDPS